MKTEITRTQLKEIYEIACKNWKSKISAYGAKDPFSEIIKFSEKEIQEMVNASTDEQLPIVKNIFEIKDIMTEIGSIDDAINRLGENDEEVIQLRKLESIKGLSEAILNEQMAVVIVKALNDGWVADWDNHNEFKYFPWFYLGKNFRFGAYHSWYSLSSLPSRLCLKDKKLAIYAGQTFTEIYKKFMN